MVIVAIILLVAGLLGGIAALAYVLYFIRYHGRPPPFQGFK